MRMRRVLAPFIHFVTALLMVAAPAIAHEESYSAHVTGSQTAREQGPRSDDSSTRERALIGVWTGRGTVESSNPRGHIVHVILTITIDKKIAPLTYSGIAISEVMQIVSPGKTFEHAGTRVNYSTENRTLIITVRGPTLQIRETDGSMWHSTYDWYLAGRTIFASGEQPAVGPGGPARFSYTMSKE